MSVAHDDVLSELHLNLTATFIDELEDLTKSAAMDGWIIQREVNLKQSHLDQLEVLRASWNHDTLADDLYFDS